MTHQGFILAAYGATALVLLALVAWIMLDGLRLRRSLEALEARGARRRSAPERQEERMAS